MNGSIVLSMDECQMKHHPVVQGLQSFLVRHPQQMKQAENENQHAEDELAPSVSKFVMDSVNAVGQRLIL